MQTNMEDDEIYVNIYNNLTKLRRQMPKTIYSNSDRLIKILNLIIEIRTILDSYTIKTITQLAPGDREKLEKIKNKAIMINSQLKRNNYEQLNTVDIYMREFVDTIRFIFTIQDASKKINEMINKEKQNKSVISKPNLTNLQDELLRLQEELSDKSTNIIILEKKINDIELNIKLHELKIDDNNKEIKLAEIYNKPNVVILNNKNNKINEDIMKEKLNLIEKYKEFNTMINEKNKLQQKIITLTK